ncbi:hypothetical protein KIW84_066215 [Lathyrus oleraceus]|uniref:Uncharacterized protein n=1 Tax=Pisum sativum TaxID=3888 RepID=A0A9D4WF62_PEA|nr:hypothetical protein KIW84_066215 [Pisum sativum]
MASQLSSKGKGKCKASSSRGSLDLSRFFTTKSQQERYETFFFQKKIMKPKYSTFDTFPEDVFTFPNFKSVVQTSIYNKRKKSFGGDNPERVYWSPTKFSIDDRMLHYFLVYVVVPRFSNHCTITDPEMMLLYSIKTHVHVDWGHSILSHMMSHDEHVEGLPYAHLLTKIFRHFNINMENELCFSMENPSFMISIKQINSKMGVIYNPRAHEIKYLDNEDEEPQQEANSDDEFNPPTKAQPDQPSNQMIMEYLQGFRTDVMTEIGHLSSRMNRWELSQARFQGSSCSGVFVTIGDID